MNYTHNKGKSGTDLSAPTESQVEEAGRMAEEKYGILLPAEDARKLAGLLEELGSWLEASEGEFGADLEAIIGSSLEGKAGDYARNLYSAVPDKEKRRIGDEIRAILVTHREVLRDPNVEEKVSRLFELRHGFGLTEGQMEQIVPLLSRTLWFEEGLDKSLGGCLDDLLTGASKEEIHGGVIEAVDLAAGRISGKA